MHTTRVGSHTVAYDDTGAGQPVLFISGLASTRMSWRKQIEVFSRKYRVINMDNRDAGDSAPGVGPYSIADMAADTAGLIQNLELGATHIIAISMGGMIALELAIRYPHLVNKLVLVSTTAGGPQSVNAKPEILALLINVDGESNEARVRRIYPQLTGEGYMAAHPEDLEQIVKNSLDKPITLEGYQRQLGAVMGHASVGAAGQLDKISAPTLVLHGDADPLVPYPNGQFLAGHIPGAQLVTFPGVGHLLMIEAAERFNREVLAFLG
jgi:pimeloyl-ACP methyl ester carboxylesterase